MNIMKKIIAVLLAICVLFSVSGCLLQVDDERNRAIVVAVIDDTTEITKGEFIDAYNSRMYYTYYLYAQYGITITDEMVKTWKENVLNDLVNDKVLDLEVEKREFPTNDEDRQKARDDYEKLISDKIDELKKEAGDDTEGRDFDKEARDYYLDLIKENDFEDLDAYIEETAKAYRNERYYLSLVSDITVTNEEVRKAYDDLLTAQQKTPNLDADIVVYRPAGLSYKYIKITLTKEEKEAYQALVNEKKTEEAAEYLKTSSYARAEKYYNDIKGGKSFEEVMKEANDFLVANCGVKEEELKDPEEELKYYKDVSSTGFSGTLDSDLLALGDGECTEIEDVTNGTYVIAKCYSRYPSETEEYKVGNELYEKLKESTLKTKQNEALDGDGTSENPGKKAEIIATHKIKKYLSRVLTDY